MGDQSASFGALLRGHRIAAGLTQEQLAERAGLSRRGIADLERGVRRAPYRHTVARRADALARGAAGGRSGLIEASRRARTRVPRAESAARARVPPLPVTGFVGRARELAEID